MRLPASFSANDFRPTQAWFRQMKALAASAHQLPAYRLNFRPSVARYEYAARYVAAETDRIYVSRYAPTPTLSFLHEMGHYVDRRGLASPDVSGYGTKDFRSVEFRPVFEAIAHSSAVRELAAWKRRATGEALGHVIYLLYSSELWARAYSQYITTKTQHPQAMRELRGFQKSIRNNEMVERNWQDDDFLPIMKEIDALFHRRGWML